MIPLSLRSDPDELAALIGNAASSRGIPQGFIEKDFWVTEVLRALSLPIDKFIPEGVEVRPRVVFKGGTSLSRAYNLIDRFSEDIDILLARGDLELGSTALDKVLVKVEKRCRTIAFPDDVDAKTIRGEKGLYRHTTYGYPRTHESELRPHVLLELGVRGGDMPSELRSIRSLLAEISINDLKVTDDFVEFESFQMEVLCPERALIEKCAALHGAADLVEEDTGAALAPMGRHLYDIYALLGSDVADRLTPAIAAQLSADADSVSAQFGWHFAPRPGNGYAASHVFVLGTKANDALRAAYETVGPLVYGKVPTFEECMERVHGRTDVL